MVSYFPDFFFCTAPQSQERYERALVTLAKWRSSLPKVTVLQAEHGKAYEFQSERRKLAENLAQTPIYIVADDDMEPTRILCPRCWVNEGVRIMTEKPPFALLSPFLEDTRFSENPVPGGPWDAYEDEDVKEFHNTGGIRFIRKGIVSGDWPPQLRRGYDEEHCRWYQKDGYRVGYFKNLWALHPGYKSETWSPVTDFVCPPIA